MKRKMTGAAAAYMAGLFFASFFSIKAAAVLGIIFVMGFATSGQKVKDIAVFTISCLVAASSFYLYKFFYYDDIVRYSGTKTTFEGEVSEINSYSSGYFSYVLKGTLGKHKNVSISYFGKDLDVRYGDVITLEDCTLSDYENTYLFKTKNYNMSKGIFLTASSPENVTVEARNKKPLKNALMEYREKMILRFEYEIGPRPGGFLAGMVFGAKREVDNDIKSDLKSVGMSHVLAISGLHVSIIATVFMAFLKRLRLGKVLPFLLLNVVMLVFITMANEPVSGIRAAVMIDFYYAASLFRRQGDTFNSLAAAILIICLLNPFSLYSTGFIMSVAATFGIGVFAPYMTKNISGFKLKKNFLQLLCLNVFIFPLSLYFFDETSLISPLTNLVLLPLCSSALIIGAIYVMTGGILPVLFIAKYLITPFLLISDKLSQLSLTHFYFDSKYSDSILLTVSFVVFLVHINFGKRGFTAVASAAAFGVIVVFSSMSSSAAKKNVRIAVLGNDKRSAVAIVYDGKCTVFDLSAYSKAPQYISKYLHKNGTFYADSVFLTKKADTQFERYCELSEEFGNASWYTKDKKCTDDEILLCESISMKQNGLQIDYADDELMISFCGGSITFAPDESKRTLMSISAGNCSKSFFICKDGNEGTINFEITLTTDGSYKFRRL